MIQQQGLHLVNQFSVNFDPTSRSKSPDILLKAIGNFQGQVLSPPVLVQRGTGYEPESDFWSRENKSAVFEIKEISIRVDREEPPKPEGKSSTDDESYTLEVKSPTVLLTANTIWGQCTVYKRSNSWLYCTQQTRKR